jgi:predicted GIY-YIG superfamily endonuclease
MSNKIAALKEYKIFWDDISQKLNQLKGRFFVYLLLKGSEVIYVGRSRNLSCRLINHKYKKDFDIVYLAEFKTYSDLCKAEKKIIKHYSPVGNKLWVIYGT